MLPAVLITTATAARILRTSEGTVRALERRGELPATRTPTGMRLFEQAVVERVARNRAQRNHDRSSSADQE